jgi:hypothetical protein
MHFQFTLREMFLAVTLICVGLGGGVLALKPEELGFGLWSSLAVLSLPIGLIGARFGTLLQRKKVGAIAGVLLLLLFGSLLSLLPATRYILWQGRTDLEIRFLVTSAESHKSVPGASIEIQPENDGDPNTDKQAFSLTADAYGIARKDCGRVNTGGTDRGSTTIDYAVCMPWWQYRVVAAGFQPSPWAKLYVPENSRKAHLIAPGQSELVIGVSLQKESPDKSSPAGDVPATK